jgi:Leucine-rich repeat (LRR) protein
MPDSIGQLAALSSLHLRNCSSLQARSAIMQLTRLQELHLGIEGPDILVTGCALHNISRLSRLNSLSIYFADIQELPDSFSKLTVLTSLRLGRCDSLQQLPDTLGQLTALRHLDLGGCERLQQLPDTIGQLTALSSLGLDGCNSLQQLPDTISQLTSLALLNIAFCSSLQQLTAGLELPPGCIDMRGCVGLGPFTEY